MDLSGDHGPDGPPARPRAKEVRDSAYASVERRDSAKEATKMSKSVTRTSSVKIMVTRPGSIPAQICLECSVRETTVKSESSGGDTTPIARSV